MVKVEYANAYTEVLEILKYISKEDFNKIPNDKIKLFETNANSNYNFHYNPEKTLEEQNISKITKGIIALLFKDYWANEKQKKKIIEIYNNQKIKSEEEKRNLYDTDIFKDKCNKVESENKHEFMMIKYQEPLIKRILNKIIDIFL